MSDIEIAVEVRAQTKWPGGERKAVLVTDGNVEEWVPWSQVNDYSEDSKGNITSIFIPEWIAEEKGFI